MQVRSRRRWANLRPDFSGDPRSGSSVRGFIDFGDERGRDDRVVSEGLRKISRADRASR